jgi:hypothetical protein
MMIGKETTARLTVNDGQHPNGTAYAAAISYLSIWRQLIDSISCIRHQMVIFMLQ